MKTTVALLAILFLAGCANDPISTGQTDNKQVQVDLLFTHDGCKVYRFFDAYEYRYFANCGLTSDSFSSHRSGKTTKPDEFPTTYSQEVQ